MTIQEFSDQFDVLYNNISSNQAPGLTEYEKSVFLTKAQSEIVKNYFIPQGNKYQEGFDDSQKRQYDFSSLIRVANLFNVNSFTERISALEKLDKRSHVFLFPENYFLSVNEIVSDSSRQYSVIPLSYTEYQRMMSKPYALPPKRQAWRLLTDKKNCNYLQEYIDGTDCDYTILSSWADQKRNLKITVKYITWQPTWAQELNVTQKEGYYYRINSSSSLDFQGEGHAYYGHMVVDGYWSNDKKTYCVDIDISTNQDDDDEALFNAIRWGFYLIKETAGDSELGKVMRHVDGFTQAQAPSKFLNIRTASTSGGEGKVFETHCIELPIAELIGSFSGKLDYQLRYVRRPYPIILADLSDSDVSIEGESAPRECLLPVEIHEEILQRAVELAKIAWAGDPKVTVEAGQRSE